MSDVIVTTAAMVAEDITSGFARMPKRDEGVHWLKAWEWDLLRAEVERLTRELVDYDLLKRAVNESTNECGPDCDSHGHGDSCPANDGARWLIDQQKEIERLRGLLREALPHVHSRKRKHMRAQASAIKRGDSHHATLHETVAYESATLAERIDAALAGATVQPSDAKEDHA